MTSPERIIIDPQGPRDPQAAEPPIDLLATITWLTLGGSIIGDLALAFQQASTSLRLGFAVITVMSSVALAGRYARRRNLRGHGGFDRRQERGLIAGPVGGQGDPDVIW